MKELWLLLICGWTAVSLLGAELSALPPSPASTNRSATKLVADVSAATGTGPSPNTASTQGWRLFWRTRKPTMIRPAPPLVLTPARQRISDQAIANDLRYFDGVEKRLEALQPGVATTHGYHLAKAQSWLDLARSEYLSNNRTRFVEAAVHEATNLLAQLESKATNIDLTTPLLPLSHPIRPDLWQLADRLKQHPNFAQGEGVVARLEVQLVWAGHIDRRHGWRAASPYLQTAEELTAQAIQVMNVHPESPSAAPIPSVALCASDSASLDALQQRLARLNGAAVPIASYHFAKAQHWLDFARCERDANDRSEVVRAAAEQAQDIIEQLEAGHTNLTKETKLLKTSRRIRSDLWQLAEELKRHPDFCRGEDVVARLEVQLVWAGHEERQLGWRSARPFVQAAERLAREAQTKIGAALEAKPSVTAPSAGAVPVAAPSP